MPPKPRSESGSKPKPVTDPAPALLSHEAVAERAYAIWLSRGGMVGDPAVDWLAAEAQLRLEIEQRPTRRSVRPKR